jgi:pimeloyl-ACP methyl ester carboxylesterase
MASCLGAVVLALLATSATLVAAADGASPAAVATAAESPCRVRGVAIELRCGSVRRALDPARPDGTTIDVHYARAPAVARGRSPDPVFLLAGGPGQSAIDIAAGVLPLLSRLNNRRDVVFIDQRGTGRSAPLGCDEPQHEALAHFATTDAQLQRLRDCLARLATTAPLTSADDLRFFTTTLAAGDLDAVRERLGAERINLIGASYGTRVALEYGRQFPERVRRRVLDGVVPPDMVLPESAGIDTQVAFDAMLQDCERSARCAGRFQNLRRDWQDLLASLPREVSVDDPVTGTPQRFTLDRDRFLGAVRGPLYVPSLAAGLPQALTDAARGRFAGLFGLGSVLADRRGGGIATGMHFSVVCSEDAPRMGSVVSTGVGDFAEQGAALYRRACGFWPRGVVPAEFYSVSPSRGAVLLLSGGLDPATPPRHAQRVAGALGPMARSVVVAQAGHGLLGTGCVRDVIQRFISADDDAAAVAVDAQCLDAVPRPPVFEPLSAGASESKR